MPYKTVFDRVRHTPDELLVISEIHQVFAAVDTFPKLPYQCVIAPFEGGKVPQHLNQLPFSEQMKLFCVAGMVGEKILKLCKDNQRVLTNIDGNGVPDHAHIVVAAGERKQGRLLYDSAILGSEAVEQTLEAIRFTPQESQILEVRLDSIALATTSVK